MIKATARDSQGHVLLILGLSDANLHELRRNRPIKFDIEEMGITPDEPIREVLVIWGTTEDAMAADFRKHGLVTAETAIIRDPKLDQPPRTPGTPTPGIPGAYFTIDTQCPKCGKRITAAGNPNEPNGRAPVPGDMTVCMGCGAFLRFVDGLDVRAVTDEEEAALVGEEREAYEAMRAFVQKTKAAHDQAEREREPDATVIDENGHALPLDPAAARAYMERQMEHGDLVAVMLRVGDQLSLQVRGQPTRKIAQALEQAALTLRRTLKGH